MFLLPFAAHATRPSWLRQCYLSLCPSSRSFSTSSLFRPLSRSSEPKSVSAASEAETFASVVGTAPYRASYTLLQHPRPPSTYPPRLDAEFSPLGRELMVQAVRRKGNVNFWWEGEQKGEGVVERGEDRPEEERYPFVTFYAPLKSGQPLGFGVRTGVVTASHNPESFFDSLEPGTIDVWDEKHGVYLLVCTHGARDCRCGDRGIPFVNALRNELGMRRERDGQEDAWERIRVGEVAHVGGHKYAPNLLVFPFGDLLAQLTPAHVPLILDSISSRLRHLGSSKDQGANTDLEQSLAPLLVDASVWRGRMGLTKDEQTKLFEKYKSGEGV